ncbi:hypothetical protein PVAP13_6NG240709 [Panicum virgatum]|uniref:Uncharacterized protein n=1 Tax=Panicum virgatum TaxID=38727 RepID=A0A8T0R0Y5_PANVG|nr:hypothetical protein PVAP13_6NG240709 [Panicum virgatum]
MTSYTVTHTFCLTGERLRDSLPRKAGIGEVIDTALHAAAPRRLPASSPLSRKYRALYFPGTAGPQPQPRPRRRRPSPSLTAVATAPNVPGCRRARLRPRRHRPSPTRHGSPPRSRYHGSSVTSRPATTQRAAPSRPNPPPRSRASSSPALFAAAPTPSRSAAARSSRFRRWPIILVFNRSMAPSRARFDVENHARDFMEVAKKLRSYFISLQREDQQQKRCFGRRLLQWRKN